MIDKGKIKKTIDVGFVKNNKPKSAPEIEAYLKLGSFLKNHLLKNNQLSIINAVCERSIK